MSSNQIISFDQWFRNVHKLNDLENGKIMDISFAKYLEPVLDGYMTEPVTMIDNAPVLLKTQRIRHIYEFKQYLSSPDISAYLYTAVLNHRDGCVTAQYAFMRHDTTHTPDSRSNDGAV